MVSAWRQDVPRAGRRSCKKDISVRFYAECCVGGGLSGRTHREVEHDKLKERRGGWGCESGVTSPKILGSVGGRVWASASVSRAYCFCGGAVLTALALCELRQRACEPPEWKARNTDAPGTAPSLSSANSTSSPAKFFLLVPVHLDAFFEPRPPLPSFFFSLTLGGFGSPSSDPGLPLRTGSACSAFRFPPTRFPAELPLRCKAPRPERPIPPQTTHTLPSHAHQKGATQGTTMCMNMGCLYFMRCEQSMIRGVPLIDNNNVRAVKEQCSTSSRQTTMNILDSILPVLRVAQAAAAGNPVPGLEGAITGVVALAEMVSTMKGNTADLPELDKRLKRLTDIDTVGCSDNLKQRLNKLKENLEPIPTRLTSLEKKSKIKQFWKGKKYGNEIQDIKAFIESHLQDFTHFYQNFGGSNVHKRTSLQLIGWIHLSKEWNQKWSRLIKKFKK
ncbi:hypothetical protein B0H14DRAFT_3168915 [Mycena olivaceomarginata]|nr:hypothetical protein B0H14DRAFT_3168915 [Mycena olivaceomarginata]